MLLTNVVNTLLHRPRTREHVPALVLRFRLELEKVVGPRMDHLRLTSRGRKSPQHPRVPLVKHKGNSCPLSSDSSPLLIGYSYIEKRVWGEVEGVEGVEGGGDQNMVCGAIEKRVRGEVEGVEGVEGDGDQNMVCGS